jgi:hypothetical protein
LWSNDTVQFKRALSSFPEPSGPEHDCTPWKPATHPDGGLYFYDEERVRLSVSWSFPVMADAPLKRLFTDTDMHNETMRDEIENFYNYLQQFILYDELIIPSKNYDLVLDIMVRDGGILWSYYYACHDARCLFWLETYDASYMISELFGVKSPAHVSALQSSCRVFCSFH